MEGVQGWRWGRGWGPDGPSAVLQAPALACTAAVLCCPLLLAQAPCVAASRLPNTHTLTALPPTCPAPLPLPCPQPGSEMVAAGYCMYGSMSYMMITTGKGVAGFTLDPTLGGYKHALGCVFLFFGVWGA